MLLLRSRITLRYYLDFVTVILTAPSLQTYVVPRAVTEQTVTQSRRQVKFSVSKWLKLTQFHLFTPFFDWKKQFCKGKTYKTYEKWAIGLYISIYVRFEIGSVTDNLYRQPIVKIPELLCRASDISRTREIQVFPRNPAKFPRKRQIPQNPPEIFPNTYRQNIFNSYLGYWTCFIHPKRPNLSWNFVTAMSKQRPKTTRRF